METSSSTSSKKLQDMWDLHREYVRRYLVSLTHDADLAEDLLQETYLHAWRGFPSYRGGGARSWLSTIARNTFYSHMRRACVQAEVQSGDDLDLGESEYLGSRRHIEGLDLWRVVSRLPDDLRTAFTLRHQMGMSYQKIGRRTDCSAVAARSRVHRAISLIRSALDEDWMPAAPVCDGMNTNRILDYLQGLLRPESAEAVEAHLKRCGVCRDRVGDIRTMIAAMDASGGDRPVLHLLDVDEWGALSLHTIIRCQDKSGKSPNAFEFLARDFCSVRGVSVTGARLGYDAVVHRDRPGVLRYTAELPDTVRPERDVHAVVGFGVSRSRRAVRTDRGTFRLDWDQLHRDEGSYAYMQAIRLPKGSRFLSSESAPSDVITRGCTTLVLFSALVRNEPLRNAIEYRPD